MNIYPQDLATEEAQSVQHSRDASAPPKWNVDLWDGTNWPAWAWWGFGGPVLSLIIGFLFQSVDVGAILLLFSVAMVVALAFMRRGQRIRPLRAQEPLTISKEPLTASEVWDIRGRATDPLKLPYLVLVVAAINTPSPLEVESQKSVREALRTLGESIAGLPPLDRDGTQDDPAAFQLQATHLSAEADAERDPVIAASLRRRADALHRQAETAERTNTLLRRNEALRQEIAGQIAALQTSLTALRVGGAQAVYELADVAANIQQVAIEAGAITQARSEMGDIVTVARRETPPAVQQVRR